jgi:hypothetical protein
MFMKLYLHYRSTGSGQPPEKVAHRVGWATADCDKYTLTLRY